MRHEREINEESIGILKEGLLKELKRYNRQWEWINAQCDIDLLLGLNPHSETFLSLLKKEFNHFEVLGEIENCRVDGQFLILRSILNLAYIKINLILDLDSQKSERATSFISAVYNASSIRTIHGLLTNQIAIQDGEADFKKILNCWIEKTAPRQEPSWELLERITQDLIPTIKTYDSGSPFTFFCKTQYPNPIMEKEDEYRFTINQDGTYCWNSSKLFLKLHKPQAGTFDEYIELSSPAKGKIKWLIAPEETSFAVLISTRDEVYILKKGVFHYPIRFVPLERRFLVPGDKVIKIAAKWDCASSTIAWLVKKQDGTYGIYEASFNEQRCNQDLKWVQNINVTRPIKDFCIGDFGKFILYADGQLWKQGEHESVIWFSGKKMECIYPGFGHILALSEDKQIHIASTVKSNVSINLSKVFQSLQNKEVKAIFACGNFSAIILKNNEVYISFDSWMIAHGITPEFIPLNLHELIGEDFQNKSLVFHGGATSVILQVTDYKNPQNIMTFKYEEPELPPESLSSVFHQFVHPAIEKKEEPEIMPARLF